LEDVFPILEEKLCGPMLDRKIDDSLPLGKRYDAREDAKSVGEFRRRAEGLGFSQEEIDTLLKVYGPQYPLNSG